jgi:hypothetical protein
MTTPIERTRGPLEPEDNWYDDQGRVIVTSDDRFHGYAGRMMEMVESLSAWGDPALWQYHLDLLREAIDHEQDYVDREKRLALRGGYETLWSNRKPFRDGDRPCNCATPDDCHATTTPDETPGCRYPRKETL